MTRPHHEPRPECWTCIMDISTGAVNRAIGDEDLKFELMHDVARTMVSDLDRETNLPALSTKIFRMISNRTGNPDPFREEKDECNRIARPLAEAISEGILEIDDPNLRIERAALATIAGNTMDLGTSGHSFDLESFEDEYHRTLDEGLAVNDAEELVDLSVEVDHVLYLADNAGEIAFDRILVRALSELGTDVTVAVKGGPVSNDATLRDAEYVGMNQVATVITTGTDHLGVNFEESSREFLDIFDSAGLILSKGQSNFETLVYDFERLACPVAFVLKTKCGPIARSLNVSLGANVLKVVSPAPHDR